MQPFRRTALFPLASSSLPTGTSGEVAGSTFKFFSKARVNTHELTQTEENTSHVWSKNQPLSTYSQNLAASAAKQATKAQAQLFSRTFLCESFLKEALSNIQSKISELGEKMRSQPPAGEATTDPLINPKFKNKIRDTYKSAVQKRSKPNAYEESIKSIKTSLREDFRGLSKGSRTSLKGDLALGKGPIDALLGVPKRYMTMALDSLIASTSPNILIHYVAASDVAKEFASKYGEETARSLLNHLAENLQKDPADSFVALGFDLFSSEEEAEEFQALHSMLVEKIFSPEAIDTAAATTGAAALKTVAQFGPGATTLKLTIALLLYIAQKAQEENGAPPAIPTEDLALMNDKAPPLPTNGDVPPLVVATNDSLSNPEPKATKSQLERRTSSFPNLQQGPNSLRKQILFMTELLKRLPEIKPLAPLHSNSEFAEKEKAELSEQLQKEIKELEEEEQLQADKATNQSQNQTSTTGQANEGLVSSLLKIIKIIRIGL